MIKQILPVALALTLTQGLTAQSRFDAISQMAIDHYKTAVLEPGSALAPLHSLPFELDATSRSETTAEVLVLLNEGTTVDDIEAAGLDVITLVGNVAIAEGTISDIIALAETDLAVQVSFPRQTYALLNNAREKTGVDQVHAGTGLQQAYNGEGVIAGIFDVGMDPNHINFKYDDGYSRINTLWRYSSSSRNPTKYSAGKMGTFTTDDRYETHGTHTMGCMAGSYNGSGDYYTATYTGVTTAHEGEPIPYYGMAPGAEILAACGPSTSANIIAGLEAMRNEIVSSGQPGVLSLSFGSNIGPHDGSDPTSQALCAISRDVPLFIAAGNEGEDGISLIKTFSAGDTESKTMLKLNTTPAKGTIDIWSATNEELTVTIVVYDRTAQTEVFSYDFTGTGTGTIASSSYTASTYIKDSNFDRAFQNSTVAVSRVLNSTNNRYNVAVTYTLTPTSTNSSSRFVLGVKVSGQPGQHFDLVHDTRATNGYGAQLSNWGVSGWENGGNGMSISDMACGADLICIGAFNTRQVWGQINGGSSGYYGMSGYKEEYIAGYSSYGTLADGTTRPHVCAPGSGIISSVSQYYVAAAGNSSTLQAVASVSGKNNYYEAMQGTSMATPVAAGIGALWMQANPDLNYADIHNIIKTTSTTDRYTRAATDRPEAWGAGKINALEGIKMAVNLAGVADVKVDAAKIVVLNNANGWEIVAPGAAKVNATLFDLNGRQVRTAAVKGDTAEMNANGLQPGVYVLSINNQHTQRVLVR